MRLFWAIVAGGLIAGLVAWWTSRDTPEQAAAKRERAEKAAAAQAEAARPKLYRWRDAQGRLQVSTEPPKGHKYETIDMAPKDGIEVHGERSTELPDNPPQ
ncbi:DUF4124 domain-containing protein [Lysobacter fragariae]